MGVWHLSLRRKFVLVFLALTLLPLGMAGYRDAVNSFAAVQARAHQSLRASALQTADRIDHFFRGTLNSVRVGSRVPIWGEYLSLAPGKRAGSSQERRAHAMLRALVHLDDLFISSCALLDAEGRNLLDTVASDIGRDESGMSYFRMAFDLKRPCYTPVEFFGGSEQALLHFAHPIFDDSDHLVGVLRVRFGSAVLQYLVSSAMGLAGERSFPILLDEHHVRLAQPNAPEETFKALGALTPEQWEALRESGRVPLRPLDQAFSDLPEFEAGLSQVGSDAPYFRMRLTSDGSTWYAGSVVRMWSQPWLVAFVQPEDVFREPVRAQIRSSVGFLVFTMASAALAAVFFAGLLTRPILRLTSATAKMASAQLDVAIDTARGDEIGQLGRTFAHMRDSIRGMIDELRTEVDGRRRAEATLRLKNEQLSREIAERRAAQLEVSKHRDRLEEMVRERTARLEAAQAELVRQERLAVLGQLTGTVAHELRNPLGTVRASMFVVSNALGSKDAAVMRAIDRIDRNIVRCDRIIEELLDFTRAERVECHPLAVDSWLGDLLGEMDIPEDVGVETSLKSGGRVWVDAERFRRCVENVIGNACEAMTGRPSHTVLRSGFPEGSPGRLYVATRNEGGRVELEVRDDGPGITPENMRRIFEPLFSTKSFGVGLGLPMVKRIMEAHGGGISVVSTPGEGTRVVLWLPLFSEGQ